MDTKICKKCNKDKPVKLFGFRNKTAEILADKCKKCNSEYQKEHYKNNSDTYKEKQKIRESEIRLWFNTERSKLKCMRCGEAHPSCLQFHHRNPSEKEMDISLALSNGWSIDHIKREIEKCDVLCANCHFKLHWQERQV